MSQSINASFETLMRQACMTTEEYYSGAIRYLDEQFGPGYAQDHPEAVAIYVQGCSYDYFTMIFLDTIGSLTEAIASQKE